MKKKRSYVVLILVIIIFLLSNCSFMEKKVYAVEPGTRIDIPSASIYPQFNGIGEAQYDSIKWSSSSNQGRVFKEWCNQGKPTTADDLCYIKAGGADWILVAVAPTFGLSGDYIKVHVNHEGVERDYYMIICDAKSPSDSLAYFINGVHYGHKCGQSYSLLNILEFPWNGDSSKKKNFCNQLTDITYIVNGGSFFDNPDGPIGFTGGGIYGSSSGAGMTGSASSESKTFLGACGSVIREFLSSVATVLDNSILGTNKTSTLYALNPSSEVGGGSGDGGNVLNPNGFLWPSYTRKITSKFGWRTHPVTGEKGSFHRAVDIGAKFGSAIWAAASGKVIKAVTDPYVSTYGRYVEILHSNGYVTLYAHQSQIIVSVNDEVMQGQVIGYVGSSGRVTGPHLHFEIWSNTSGSRDCLIDPETVQYVYKDQ